MADMVRRRFLKAVGSGTVGIAAFFYPGATELAGANVRRTADLASPTPATPDPTYACGRVASIGAGGVTLTSGAGAVAIAIAPDAEVWKEFTVGRQAISVGDWLDVQGTPQADGSLGATSGMVFVNIARVDGVFVGATADAITLNAYGKITQCELSAALDVVHKEDGSAVSGGLSAIAPGTMIGAVGLGLPDGGLRATRVWI